jgi:translation initiation factor 3 subunit A
MAAKQRQAEIAAEEREKREREEALKARLEDKPGKFIPPSLRKKLESGEDLRRPGGDSSDTWNDRRPPVEERRPLFGGRGLAPRETDRQVEGEADIPTLSNRYQPPRARLSDPDAPPPRAYEPPVRRTYDAPGARGDEPLRGAYEPPRGAYEPRARGDEPPRGAYEPPRGGARGDAYAPPGRLGSRPLGQRPVIGGGRPADDRQERQDRW